MERMKRSVWITVLGLAVVAGAVLFAFLRPRHQAAANPPEEAGRAQARVVPVVAVAAAKRDVPIYLEGLGNVAAFKTVTVRSQVDGRLEKVLFTEGQAVKRGDVLAQIDPRPFQIQLHQAEGALSRDNSLLHDNEVNLTRNKSLREQKLVAQQAVDDLQGTVGQYEGAVAVDKAQIDTAKLNLDWARIVSPIDGVTGVRLVDPGNIVRASDQNGIVVVTQLDPIAVLFTLPQDDLPTVAKEMHGGAQLAVEAFSRDGATKLGEGRLLLIDNQINASTATIRLKAQLDNPDRMLWPNQFVKARLRVTTRQGALVVPQAAIQRGPQGLYVYLVGRDATAEQRPVEVTENAGDLALIAKGISPGEQVVVEGQNQLKPGAKVSLRAQEGGRRDGTKR
jgi:multidrug efflux system membrane fusion protein